MNYQPVLYFIQERYRIMQKKERGEPRPWTTDAILHEYSFCNVHRQDDRVSIWVTENWREPYEADPHIWFAMVLARLINWPDTLQALEGCVFKTSDVSWNPRAFTRTMQQLHAAGAKRFGGAYIVSTNGREIDKAEYLRDYVLNPMWLERARFLPHKHPSLESLYAQLRDYNGMGSFIAAQVVADVKFTPPYLGAPDWWTFAASGPGSRRGLNRLLGRPVDAPWKEHEWLKALRDLQVVVDREAERLEIPRISAQDLQNCLCETDKYLRTQNGEGRPRAKYKGAT